MIQEVPTSCRWILAGDFNMVEARQDKTNPCGRLVPILEPGLLTNLKRHLNVEDNRRSPDSLPYSWDNFRNNGQRILARLDRAYLFKNSSGQSQRKLINYSIRSDNGWSDHSPVITTIEFDISPIRSSRWKMSRFLLEAA